MNSSIARRHNVNIVGKGSQTLIFAQGFGTDQTAWRHQVATFGPNYRIVLFDHVGAGDSDFAAYSPHRYSTLHSYAEDLLDLCSELKLTHGTFISHSVSGMIGLLAALAEPKLFNKLVFVGASPRYLNDTGYVGGFDRSDLDKLYAAMSSNYYAWASGFAPLMMGNPERPELAAELAKTLIAIRPDIAQAVSKVIFESDYRQELPQLKVPTLILQAQHDPAVPVEVGRYMSQKIPKSQLIEIDARGHFPHISAPEKITQAIASYLSSR
ncbi:MAG: alpha/beta hydrolase [Microcoleus sp. PH2017_10_PVI_O_A]|uniref:alpha/beta fold hydrolase n=1 Tax=unclassified Microcoleus TaxID=2642155 RepID=UPI001E140B28|nr:MULTISPECIES: alpha/beta hydrolase [unclassified Microcoleus]TAE79912.1 MAG: alpha/beta hydrolase [Oscillatoriales cyanobacterium]MCC3407889.1 alpha/beta hydrolase [Microcoleus sp. PH2017_10_PVI_O_A]MCC3462025.1 alpha/beta hydrolase [Microcoleus sp. PH2017_11_PCY_U_A]MCC3480493.1 alpha/beta hydrolase [Microcoleus sp. PH2017_12_PCY_D_A]MCC3561335.1 alpha/beta hydrolase [Microcoleus sp. PH2017_27_LUM_O_A]